MPSSCSLRKLSRGVAATAALLPLLLAQEPTAKAATGPAPAGQRFDVTATMQALQVRYVAIGELTVARSAWLALAFLENGSTMRVGPCRDSLKQVVQWLRSAQDEQGRFAPNGTPANRFDQTLAALAMVESYDRSNYQLLKRNAMSAAAAVEAATLTPAAAPDAPGPQLGAMLAVLAAKLASMRAPEPELSGRIAVAAKTELAKHVFGNTRSADAALHLGQLLLGEPFVPDLTVARTWPANLTADPLHTVFGMLAVRTDAGLLERQSRLLGGLLATRVAAGDAVGTWPAAAGLDATTTTAMLAMAVGIANQAAETTAPR
jgi:hypothetical protein